jgi:hypothetical protein
MSLLRMILLKLGQTLIEKIILVVFDERGTSAETLLMTTRRSK